MPRRRAEHTLAGASAGQGRPQDIASWHLLVHTSGSGSIRGELYEQETLAQLARIG